MRRRAWQPGDHFELRVVEVKCARAPKTSATFSLVRVGHRARSGAKVNISRYIRDISITRLAEDCL